MNINIDLPISPCSMVAVIMLLLISGCSESPRGKYTRLCMEVAATDDQRESCRCMAREYDEVLDKQEFDAITMIMDKSVKELKGRNADMFNMPGYVDYEGVDKRVLVSALKKMQPLHQARVCGYITR